MLRYYSSEFRSARKLLEKTRGIWCLSTWYFPNQPDEEVNGCVDISLKGMKKFDHLGIKIELIGRIGIIYSEIPSDSSLNTDFLNTNIDLKSAGSIAQDTKYAFSFPRMHKPYETYNGVTAKLRYFVRLSVIRSYAPNIIKEQEICIFHYSKPPSLRCVIKREVGYEDYILIEVEMNNYKFHLKDCLKGKVYFINIKIPIRTMEASIVRKEIVGNESEAKEDSSLLSRFEILDGMPGKRDYIPFRMYLANFPLTPSYKTIHNRFSVQYFFQITLFDEHGNKFVKQQPISLWRKE